ncbi:biotin--[acetyl-CoA-carboxylase] ligase [Kosmotoga pacifica]|uniref:Biotin--acetyl-CoA-carboxylase ligase n=1 Tax=Kosmotoga pacifica TaxID=1330330 RepID=A0A0G2Z6I4_9BACT|nr:biotin--[acetyl-CoA-carboxylase] ligase [Kosmotoga pacifica]AKI97210.1 biotin--acetyl-CoA-carboxylase ligase [Kosmotoga pacifica]
MVIGEEIFSFTELPSTNRYAIENLQKLPSGSVVWALEQSAGYGRFNREWHSSRGGLWFSIVFKPRLLKDTGYYTKLISVGVAELLQELGCDAAIKWPNDVYVNGRKIAGILTEAVTEGEKLIGVVTGIGINVHNEIPPELSEIAISLKEATTRNYEVGFVLKKLLNKLESLRRKYLQVRMKKYFIRRWKKYLIHKAGDEITVSLPDGKKVTGVIEKINSEHLLLKTGEKTIKITAGEIR